MVILVTGGTGYIGSLLIRELPYVGNFKGETIRIFDNMASNKYYSLFNLPSAKYELILGDLKNEKDVKKAFKDVRIVFDLAGFTSVPLSYKMKKETFETNVKGVEKILNIAISSDIEKIVYSSSAAVYGNVKGIVDENHKCNPQSPYARSKLLAEELYLKAYKNSELPVNILRFGTVFGFAPGIRFDTVINRFVFLASIGYPLTIWKGAEEGMRPYLHVKDAINALIKTSLSKIKGEVFNVTSVNAKLKEVIKVMQDVIPDIKVTYVEAPYKEQVSYGLNINKIRKIIGYNPSHTLKDGIEEVFQKFKNLIK